MTDDERLLLEEQAARGRRAEEFLANPLWEEIWSEELKRITDAWVNPAPNQTPEQREELFKEMRVMKSLRAALTRRVRQGESAAKKMAIDVARLNGAGERKGG